MNIKYNVKIILFAEKISENKKINIFNNKLLNSIIKLENKKIRRD